MRASRSMVLTAELVAFCQKCVADTGADANADLLTDEDFRTTAIRLAEEAGDDVLWVFAYGSLIWKPAFAPAGFENAVAHGVHRSFCMQLTRWRGSAEQPGLMMALQRGGQCKGVVYRMSDESRVSDLEALLRRELDDREGLGFVKWIPVDIAGRRSRALSFWVAPKGEAISAGQPLELVADVLARACGHIGSGAEYLYHTVRGLEQAGIRDRNLWRLQELVADRIRSIHGLQPALDSA